MNFVQSLQKLVFHPPERPLPGLPRNFTISKSNLNTPFTTDLFIFPLALGFTMSFSFFCSLYVIHTLIIVLVNIVIVIYFLVKLSFLMAKAIVYLS